MTCHRQTHQTLHSQLTGTGGRGGIVEAVRVCAYVRVCVCMWCIHVVCAYVRVCMWCVHVLCACACGVCVLACACGVCICACVRVHVVCACVCVCVHVCVYMCMRACARV